MVLRSDTSHGEILELIKSLQKATLQPTVRLVFKNGRHLDGAITYQERTGTGRIINIEEESARDYNLYDVKEVVY
ncbi:MAG: hypothetical protein MK213_07060 [Planctomycetes bacterium]|nr:hypothetical protein [Planctomycetota bacterium]